MAETGLVGREVGEDVLVETRVDDFFLDFRGYAKKGDGAIVCRGGFGTFFVDRRYSGVLPVLGDVACLKGKVVKSS